MLLPLFLFILAMPNASGMRFLNKKVLISAFCLFCALICRAQERITVMDMGTYVSFYCPAVKGPLYVTYPLYKGGGPFNRDKMGFNKCGMPTASRNDYTNSGFERGHLANAGDFGYSYDAQKLTFCMCNIVPQTWALNHGDWLTLEARIRQLSQCHHLFIIAGAVYSSRRLKPGKDVYVPDACYKIVYDVDEHHYIFYGWFKNDNEARCETLSREELLRRVNYHIDTRIQDFAN